MALGERFLNKKSMSLGDTLKNVEEPAVLTPAIPGITFTPSSNPVISENTQLALPPDVHLARQKILLTIQALFLLMMP